jgi:hypothetical protein
MPEELKQEPSEDKTIFLDALKWLETTTKYTCHFDTDNTL